MNDQSYPSRRRFSSRTPNVPVWPGHKTPAVNRGYRSETLRADSTLAHYTSAGSPTSYVGDRLPAVEQADNAEPAIGHCHAVTAEVATLVRTPVDDGVGHRPQGAFAQEPRPVQIDRPGDPAHGLKIS